MTDTELIEAAQNGDNSAFSQLVENYQRNVRACLAVRLTNRFEVDDLAQEAFLVAYRKINEFDSTKAFGPWIRSIAFYLLKNYWRKHKPDAVGGSAELQILVDEEIGLQYSEKNESDSLAALKICTKKLDENLQKIVRLHYHDGLSVGELTKQFDIKHSAMTMKLHRMRDQLRRCINETRGTCQL
ncbi:RNA polymerase, sigma-24 subunit, ECF subfamily protein [Lentisphaera araneosa HTCC2155]|uniref:RNA polymerase sigma factor n=1 Tax=Lentisphaera araneosa HTCC2155 TaxID=313628 RepID=A6DSB1_9BACT|nr:sigma-70 family RNA polymerase sigma factor [Lentisphaera araneosa]EDM25456.1 RNA polymerase, sigma-24 subunit, ECF subfamily protein [Lentisphaera araneosa HTCC2155]